MAFTLPELGYAYDALEVSGRRLIAMVSCWCRDAAAVATASPVAVRIHPFHTSPRPPPAPHPWPQPFVDTMTMTIHHTKHHQAYVTNVNAALAKFPELAALGIEDLNAAVGTPEVPAEVAVVVRNNGGGVWNHNFFWCVCSGCGGCDGWGRVWVGRVRLRVCRAVNGGRSAVDPVMCCAFALHCMPTCHPIIRPGMSPLPLSPPAPRPPAPPQEGYVQPLEHRRPRRHAQGGDRSAVGVGRRNEGQVQRRRGRCGGARGGGGGAEGTGGGG